MGAPLKPAWRGWRPVDIDEPFLRDLAKRIKSGLTPELAAESFGIPRGLFRRWMRLGEEQVTLAFESGEIHHAKHVQASLWIACKQAAGLLAQELAGNVKAGHEASKDHRWLLERLQSEDYGSTDRIDVDVTVSAADPIQIEGRAIVLAEALSILADSRRRDGLPASGELVREALPAAGDVLPDPAADQRPTDGVPAQRPA